MKIRGRFAPSPSGRMHLGNLFAALLAWLSARSEGGALVLRMEDLDPDRCRPEYSRLLLDDLLWLGLTWDEGPYEQSKRTARYAAAFDRLEVLGLVYPCYCTRAERLAANAPHQGDGQTRYDGRCRGRTEPGTRPPAWRLAVPDKAVSFTDGRLGPFSENLAQDCGDFIIRRSDGVYAYQLAVVVDDGAMGVTQVVRGKDLLSSTPRQLWLYELLDLPPPEFFHVPLLLAPDGRRLSKREQDLDMGALRERFKAEEIVGRLAFLAGLRAAPSPLSPAELLPAFSWENIPKEDIFVPDSLFIKE